MKFEIYPNFIPRLIPGCGEGLGMGLRVSQLEYASVCLSL